MFFMFFMFFMIFILSILLILSLMSKKILYDWWYFNCKHRHKLPAYFWYQLHQKCVTRRLYHLVEYQGWIDQGWIDLFGTRYCGPDFYRNWVSLPITYSDFLSRSNRSIWVPSRSMRRYFREYDFPQPNSSWVSQFRSNYPQYLKLVNPLNRQIMESVDIRDWFEGLVSEII